MSRVHRHEYIALGIVGALTLGIGLISWPQFGTLDTYRHSHPRNEYYRPGGEACEPGALTSTIDASKREACQKAAEEYRQNTDDLIQQTRAANAAEAQADIASQSLWLTFFQTLGGFLTLAAATAAAWFAREAAKHTETSAGEAKRSADAAEENLRHSSEITKAQLRAYIAAQSESFQLSESNMLSLRLNLKNVGQTPATVTRTMRRATKGITGPRAHKVYEVGEFQPTAMGTVGPQVPIEVVSDIELTSAFVTGIKNGRATVEFFIEIEFIDAFEERWLYTQHLMVTNDSFTSNLVFTKRCETRQIVDQAEPELPLDGGANKEK